MKHYIQFEISGTAPEVTEIVIAMLSAFGFNGFEERENLLLATGQQGEVEAEEAGLWLNEQQISYRQTQMAEQNWNALWESNFSPVVVDDFAGVRAHFHPPNTVVKYDLVITPKMSFGTGHHGTTYSVMQLMRGIDFANKSVFDFGTGTGLLAILAHKLGAVDILAVDNDDWCIENASENIVVNNTQSIEIHKVDNAKLNKKFNIIIANINKNIILDNLAFLAEATVPGGVVLLSGLLVEDEPEIESACAALGWKHQETRTRNNWIALHYSV